MSLTGSKLDKMFLIMLIILAVIATATVYRVIHDTKEYSVRTHKPVMIVPDSDGILEVTVDTSRGIACYSWQGSSNLSCAREK